MWTCSGVSLFVTIVTFWSVVRGHNQRIETFLTAKWKPTSPLAEAAEFISDVDPTLFWKFLDNVFEKQETFPLLTSASNDDVESDMSSVSAFNLISPAKLRMMEWSLTSRAYSPRVHMLQELAPSSDLISKDCTTFVQYGKDKVSCNVEELEELISHKLNSEIEHSYITEQDHKYPSYIWNQENPPIIILYGHPAFPNTKKFHDILKSKADEVGYIYRSYKPSNGSIILSGYGVELQFKSTEYVAQDDTGKSSKTEEVGGFIFEKLYELHPELSENLEKFQNYLTSERGKKAGFEALKAWQVQELGLQASHYTTLQDNILESLLDVSGNFPSRAGSLSSIRVPNDFKKSLTYNQKILQSHFNIDEGEGSFFLQGNQIDPDSLDLFTFMETLQVELDLMESLRSIYHDIPQTRTKLNSYLQIGSRSSSEPDLALDLRDSSIFWINDLEKDEEYEDWPEDLTQLFFRMGGIMLRPVRRNVFNLLLSLNPDDVESTAALLKLAQSFMAHKAPLRVGVVFCSEHREMSNSLEDDIQVFQTGDVVRRILNQAIADDKIKKAFGHMVDAFDKKDFSKLLKLFNETGEEFDFGDELACDFVSKSGRPAPSAFLNGIPLKWNNIDDFEEIVLNQLLREAQTIQTEAYQGKIRDSTDIFDYIMNKPNVQTRLNDKILDTTNAKYVPFGNEIWEPGKEQKNPAAAVASNLNHIVPPSKRTYPVSITQWILADITTPDGHTFLQNAVEFLQESSTHSRIAFIPTDVKKSTFRSNVVNAITQNDLKQVLRLLRDSKHQDEDDSIGLPAQHIEDFMKLIGFTRGAKGVIVNGRIIGPLKLGETFEQGDWALLEKYSYDSCAKYFDDNEGTSDIPMRVCSLISSPKIKAKNSKRFTLPEFDSPVNVNMPKDENEDPFYLDIKAVIDPASRHAHKMTSLLTAVTDALSQWVKIQILYNPPSKHSELPLKSYFRYIAGNNPTEKIVFDQIPREPLFTQNLLAPDNWMVEVVKGVNDPDNIRLQDLEGSASSEYELANLLVEGHCLELKTGSPPRGLQFSLTPETKGIKPAETIVMANLGYFQLKVEPGVWKLELREGPSRDIFSLETVNTKPILVHSFQSVVVKVKVKRNPGKETVSLLESEEESGGGWFGFGTPKKAETDDETINVFSLASGHLYERLLKIMMLSVLKNTKSKVKFWFLKNYLSPTIKDVLPHMAREYNFEYELVQYNWPRWLNAQREKQRIIWGYKILFLDVLFPLSLKKIVFVDADQIVRTDLKELFDLDLEGNPYGYTPFCDSRTEMDGFRFWNQGYWRTHLGKRKYHISALYVIDLVRFRKVAAGDRLRGQYQALSQDPNSLSNLDQDLPNNMIHQVGIKSLPQEWLWCETWCDDASKATAKTIDLCNNPLTKESKLDAAQRIVPEWKEYDQEIRDFQNRLRQQSISDDVHDEL